MHLQYIADKFGHTTAVQIQIPIEDWVQLKKSTRSLRRKKILPAFRIGRLHLGRKN